MTQAPHNPLFSVTLQYPESHHPANPSPAQTWSAVWTVEVVVVGGGAVVAQHFHSLISQADLAQSNFYHRTDLYLPALPAGGKKTHEVASLLLGSCSMVGKYTCRRVLPIGVSNSAWLIWTLDPLAPCSASSKSVSNSFLAAIVLDQSLQTKYSNMWDHFCLREEHSWPNARVLSLFPTIVETMRSFTQSILIEEPLQNVSSDSISNLILYQNTRMCLFTHSKQLTSSNVSSKLAWKTSLNWSKQSSYVSSKLTWKLWINQNTIKMYWNQ